VRSGYLAAVRVLRRARRMFFCASFLLLGGCMATTPKVEVVEPTTARPVHVAVQAPSNGAIFQSVAYRPLFEDRRARLVGDTLTIRIAENTTASQRQSSNVDRSGAVSGGITALPFLAPNSFNRASVQGNSSNTFEGKGATEAANNFTGIITATVIEVLPNGHLLVAGEKQIGVNQNVEIMRFSGTVDPMSIQPGNSITSNQIADARIELRGRGASQEAQTIGWLARFFLSVLPF